MQAKADYEGKPLITKDERCEIDLGLLEKFDAFARELSLIHISIAQGSNAVMLPVFNGASAPVRFEVGMLPS